MFANGDVNLDLQSGLKLKKSRYGKGIPYAKIFYRALYVSKNDKTFIFFLNTTVGTSSKLAKITTYFKIFCIIYIKLSLLHISLFHLSIYFKYTRVNVIICYLLLRHDILLTVYNFFSSKKVYENIIQ